ncbi:hypothetical protein C8J42_101947 [Sphingomonas sp. PP-CE-1A-559]|uniref:hypothetical protein n=1 Tax=Sphingomonas sp. PP-CE-1A-559 TaxID=2135657 RepID=UPI001055C12E|nr:hypothetical protein [Sphingomonas sp. PP-CE-1A-559]TCP94481.1 hypothetical protein C8J42_101947 [Sphingomonas sp. PP-CE-1A-559]
MNEMISGKPAMPLPERITINETLLAERVFLAGMEQNYPGLDPRLGLFGTGPDGAYINARYGNELVRVRSRRQVAMEGFAHATMVMWLFHIAKLVIDQFA